MTLLNELEILGVKMKKLIGTVLCLAGLVSCGSRTHKKNHRD